MKEFSQLTLRGLDADKNKDIIEILNDYMRDSNAKTGQAAIEGIIRKYYKLLKQSRELQTDKNNLQKELTQAKQDWEAETKALTNTLTVMQTYLADVETLKQGGIIALIEAQKNRNLQNHQSRPFAAVSTYNVHQEEEDEDEDEDWEEEEEDEEEYDDEDED